MSVQQEKGAAGIREIEKVLANIAEDGEFDWIARTWLKLSHEEKYAIAYYAYVIYQEFRRRRGRLGLSIVGILELLAKLGIWMNEHSYYFDRKEAQCQTTANTLSSNQTQLLDVLEIIE